MKTFFKSSRSVVMAGAAATLAVAAMGFAGTASARDNVALSVGVALPGISVGVSNGYPAYPVYRPQPVYVQPAPVYVQPQAYYGPQPVYVQGPPVYYGPPPRHWHGRHYGPGPRGYGPGYAPNYYRR